ncbi:hypothetical protein Tco_1217367 [Tanacetum coccineum]
METIHVKFDELTSMASECNNSGLGLNCSNFQDSLEKLNEIPLKKDLDNLFGPLYEDTMRRELTKLSSLEEPITNEPSTPVSDKHFDEPIQEDIIEVDGNTFINPFGTHAFKEAESTQLPSTRQYGTSFTQQHSFTLTDDENHPIEQVIGDPSKFVTTRSRLHTDAEMRIWIESMQDELNQLKRLDVCELFERPIDRNVIKAHPTEKHLKEVKKIFRYLKHSINMGLWYSNDSGFELIQLQTMQGVMVIAKAYLEESNFWETTSHFWCLKSRLYSYDQRGSGVMYPSYAWVCHKSSG